MIREEVELQLRPLRDEVGQLGALMHQLSPLASFLAPFAGPAPTPERPSTVPARRGRPPGSKNKTSGKSVVLPSGRGGRGANARGCAIIDCRRPSRTKGYCAAHYQKLRMLAKTNRLPGGWVDFAPQHSVKDLVLPRGRAASRALKEASGRK